MKYEGLSEYAREHTLKECAEYYNCSYGAMQTYLYKHNISHKKEEMKYNDYKHGCINTRLYRIWANMKTRCTNKNSPDYIRYGARGIVVCKEWLNFLHFKEWAVANGYSDELTLDRIDNNKGYCPENCRWVNRQIQCNNTRRNKYIVYKGVTKTVAQWARLLRVPYCVLYTRLYKLNWTVEKSFDSLLTDCSESNNISVV